MTYPKEGQEVPVKDTNWNRCPFCQEHNIEGGSVEIDGHTAWQVVTCTRCQGEWSEVYQASHRYITMVGQVHDVEVYLPVVVRMTSDGTVDSMEVDFEGAPWMFVLEERNVWLPETEEWVRSEDMEVEASYWLTKKLRS